MNGRDEWFIQIRLRGWWTKFYLGPELQTASPSFWIEDGEGRIVVDRSGIVEIDLVG
jgi:hypothetical protein